MWDDPIQGIRPFRLRPLLRPGRANVRAVRVSRACHATNRELLRAKRQELRECESTARTARSDRLERRCQQPRLGYVKRNEPARSWKPRTWTASREPNAAGVRGAVRARARSSPSFTPPTKPSSRERAEPAFCSVCGCDRLLAHGQWRIIRIARVLFYLPAIPRPPRRSAAERDTREDQRARRRGTRRGRGRRGRRRRWTSRIGSLARRWASASGTNRRRDR